ncbi:MAG: hypothetical protein R3A78_08660 [Polyangiales bacterium]
MLPALFTLSMVIVTSTAAAHGPFPQTTRVTFHPSDPNTILIQATFGMMITHDGGNSWSWICYEAVGFAFEEVLIAQPTSTILDDGSVVVASRRGLSRGTPDACTFASPNEALEKAFLVDLERHPSDGASAFVVTANARTENLVYGTADNGATWAPTGDPIDAVLFESLSVAPSDSTHMYLTATEPITAQNDTYRTLFYRTDDSGASWDRLEVTDPDTGSYLVLLATKPTDPNVAVMMDLNRLDYTARRLYRTTDGGDHWSRITDLEGKRITSATWSTDGTALWFGGSSGTGLWVSSNDGATVSTVNADLEVYCMNFRDGELWTCSNQFTDGFAVGRSSDGGETFTGVFNFNDIRGLVECDDDSQVESVCAVQFLDLIRDLNLDLDGGSALSDAGLVDAGADAGPKTAKDTAGCGCRTAGQRPGGPWVPMLSLGTVLGLALRRRVARRRDR